jgi:hypothetical protein
MNSEIHFYGDKSYCDSFHHNPKAKQIPYIYFHGKLEDILRYDIVYSEIDALDIPIGIYDCVVGDKMNCKAFIYLGSRCLRGLIVLQSDIDGLRDASEAFEMNLEVL